jgi:uncharacterized membrane protein SpoIIM required for sporulation
MRLSDVYQGIKSLWVAMTPLRARWPRHWRSRRGQAVMEYFVLFIFLSLVAAAVYHFMSPVIEKALVRMADVWIAKNVAGESGP